MSEKTRKSGVTFRPHFKTHQSLEIAKWFKQFKVEKITVSSLEMAKLFADNGWKDITVAFPVNILEIEMIRSLSIQINLNLLVESIETTEFLASTIQHPVQLWIKIDTVYLRTGVHWEDSQTISKIIKILVKNKNLHFTGLLTHSGHSYQCRNKNSVLKIYRETVTRLLTLQKKMNTQGLMDVRLSIGDTPTCSLVDDFSGVDEIRPGNFIFYDATQLSIGSCKEEDIALAVACPVVAKHASRQQLVIYGGAVHLSKDFIEQQGVKIFGYPVIIKKAGWGKIDADCYVCSVSQEHGIISANQEFFKKVKIGDILAILPAHSCLSMNLMKGKYFIID
jgi:D-serine deaminase-like pyridoxal phosphate-dependent protein